ncbi:MAG: RNA methyltransferase [Desulfamplus sp.]|nr:RNA methyltransferase [Desulfamplus sp.]
MLHDNFTVILVEPQGPINVGSVCRVMMNFGFKNLRLVNPCKNYSSLQARKMALNAQHLLVDAKVFNTLSEALADCHLAFGTTRRFGKYRKDFFTPEPAGETIAKIDDGIRCSLVLGREDNGLTTEELTLCQHFITIPTDDGFPSMNLSHSLGILLYEIAKAMKKRVVNQSIEREIVTAQIEANNNFTNQESSTTETSAKETKATATIQALEQMYEHTKKALCEIEFLDPQNPDHLLRTFRNIFGRAGLTERDVRIIRGLMSKIEWVNSQRNK